MAKGAKSAVSKTQAVTEYLLANPAATPKEVVDALQKQGIEVSPGSVYTIRWNMKKQGQAAPKEVAAPAAPAAVSAAPEPAAAPAPAAPAAKKGKVNKTQVIRAYVKANPGATPLEVAAALKTQGLKVSATYVSATKFKMKSKKRKAAPKAAPAPQTAPASDAISMAALLEAKKLIAKLGSVDQAKQAIAALAQLS